MDVARPLLAFPLASLLVLSACGTGTDGSPAGKVNKPSAQCESAAVSNRYLVRWNDGSLTTETAENREALIRDVITPNNDRIQFAEHAFRVQLPRSPARSMASTPASTTTFDWGQVSIGAAEAWTLAKGDGVIVAVVDSGADVTHLQLRNQIAINTQEIAGNEVDDDGNGLVDDVFGYDFERNSGNIHDIEGHGTHVSGIIVAEHLRTHDQVKGVAPNAKLLPLNFMSDDGNGYIDVAIKAIRYAAARGAKVINASWGGGGACSRALQLEIASLESQGVLFVAAAGNGDSMGIGFDLEDRPMYPAAYELPSLITVGAVNPSGRMTGFSNYSRRLVHLLAPGLRILSTFPNDSWQELDGTSMAAPFVSATAAVMWSYRPNATVAQIKSALIASVDQGDYPVASGGRLNLQRALLEIGKLVAP